MQACENKLLGGYKTRGMSWDNSSCFFAIFLYENLKLCLTMVQVIYIVNPLLQAVLMKVGKKIWP